MNHRWRTLNRKGISINPTCERCGMVKRGSWPSMQFIIPRPRPIRRGMGWTPPRPFTPPCTPQCDDCNKPPRPKNAVWDKELGVYVVKAKGAR